MNKNSRFTWTAILTAIIITTSIISNAQTVYYVDSTTGNDTHSGTSWSNAFRNVTRAMVAANASTAAEVDVWISKGTYTPVEGIATLPLNQQDTSFTFYRGNGVGRALKVYGGFAGTETNIYMRDTSHKTYLDGEISSTNKSYHVIVISGLSATADSVVIDGLTIRNGRAKDSGQKIFNGIQVVRSYGGGMCISNNASSKFKITNCKFLLDSAVGITTYYFYGYLYGQGSYGGGIYNYLSSPTFNSCDFSSNLVIGGTPDVVLYDAAGFGFGGAICNIHSSSRFINCNFMSNNATGGGLPTLEGSGGKGGGGAVYNSSSHCLFSYCNFISNTTIGGGVDDFSVLGVSGGGGFGGAVFDTFSSPIFKHCSFNGNSAKSNSSYPESGAFSGGVYNMSGSNPTFDTCIFTANKSYNATYGHYSYGAAMCNDSSSPIINSCSFTSDTSIGVFGYGGAVFNRYAFPRFINTIFSENYNLSGYVLDSNLGGAVCNFTSAPTFDFCTFMHNTVNGGGTLGFGGAVYNQYSSPVFNNCNLVSNTATSTFSGMGYGGAIYNFISNAIFTNCNFKFNNAMVVSGGSRGGAVYNDSSSSIFNLCNFTFNNSSCPGNGQGGAIYDIANAVPVITKCIFNNNIATSNGGAIFQAGSKLKLNNCLFNSNTSVSGGAIKLSNYYSYSLFTSYNNVYANNISTGGGGGAISFDMGGGIDTLVGNAFILNKDIGLTGGGALNIMGDTHFIVNNTFYSDSAISGGQGGGINYVASGGNYCFVNNIFYKNYGSGGSGDTSARIGGLSFNSHNSFSSTDPLFINESNYIGLDSIFGTADDGLHLQRCSPSRNTGLTAYVLPIDSLDITNSSRIEGVSVDLGAYESNSLGIIGGNHFLCLGVSETLTDTSAGGTWFSKNSSIATVTGTGIVNALNIGIDTIIYRLVSSCGTDTIFTIINVIPSTYVGNIIGTQSLCQGAYISLTDSISGGVWSVTNTNASISMAGRVTGIMAGVDTVKYTNSCSLGHTQLVITINPIPIIGTIIGTDTLCMGTSSILLDSTLNGVWRSYSTHLSISADTITAVSIGSATVFYIKTNSFGCSDSVNTLLAVAGPPLYATLTGSDTICVGMSTSWLASVPGGIWGTRDSFVATINSSGIINSIHAGINNIIYSTSNRCGRTIDSSSLIVQRPASAISGIDTFCSGTIYLYTDSAKHGIWSITDTSIATINDTGMVTGVTQGFNVINYMVTNSCGTSSVLKNIYIDQLATAITGTNTICTGRVTDLYDATTGGSWSSSDTSIAVVSVGFVNGMSTGTCTITYAVTNSCGTSDATLDVFILDPSFCDTITSTTAVHEFSKISVYPNPPNETIIIEDAGIGTTLRIFNMLGQLEYEYMLNENKRSISVTSLSPGAYLFQFTDSMGMRTNKTIMKE